MTDMDLNTVQSEISPKERSDNEMAIIWTLCSIVCCLFTLMTLHGWYKIGTDAYYIGMDLTPYLIWSGFLAILDLVCIHYLGKYLKGALNDPKVNA